MEIFKDDSFKKNSKIKFFQNLSDKKKLIFKFIFIISIGSILFVPIGLKRSDSKYIQFGTKFLAKSLGIFDKKYQLLANEFFLMTDNLFGITYRYLNANSMKSDKLEININFKNYEKISKFRNKAIKEGILTRSKDDKVKASITYKGMKYPIKLRLKGDWTDHLLGEKWSFRVETKSKKPFLGMREFSLQHPRTRNYINEFIFHQLLKYEKLPYLRYKFVPLSLNGKYLGIYALEEHFSKELIENSRLRDGPILKISDEDLRNKYKRMLKISKNAVGWETSENNAEVLTFNPSNFNEDKEKNKIIQFEIARKLLDKFLQNKLDTSDVFDIKMTAKYFAISDLLQALGANTWYDMRFYFDPISSRLVPIGYDAQIPIINKRRLLSIDQNVLKIFDNQEFVKEYISALDRITKNNYFENFINHINSELSIELRTLQKSFPFVRFLEQEFLKNNVYIRSRLSPLEPIGINSFQLSNDKKTLSIEMFNKYKLPIKILSSKLNNTKYNIKNFSLLEGKEDFKRVKNVIFDFEIVDYKKNSQDTIIGDIQNNYYQDLIVEYKINGSKKIQTLNLKKFKKFGNISTKDELISKKSNFKDFNLLLENKRNQSISLKENITISKPLIIPKDYSLNIAAGVKIVLKDRGLIYLQGPLIMNGTNLKKIKVESINGGKGILVLNANQSSLIEHTIFDGLKPNNNYALNVTGGLTFYNSPVKINNSEFNNSLGEDALNLVRSQFNINNLIFTNIYSDAIDIDFSNGKILNSNFDNIGNDAIDISGSDVFLNNIFIKNVEDKGISVGEKAQLNGDNISISNAYIGIASKDLSTTLIKKLDTNNLKYCLAAYKKKPEYGPGLIKIKEYNKNCNSNYSLESGSFIKLDDYNLIPNSLNTYKKLYSDDN